MSFLTNQDIAHQATDLMQSKAALTTGAAGSIAAMTPTESFGTYLTSNGIWVLSYAEIIQVIGGIWVLCLIADFGLRTFRRIRSGKLFKQ